MRGTVLMLCLLAAFSAAVAGEGEWKTYTPKSDVRSVVGMHGTAWAATSGGLFSFDPVSGAYRTWTTSEGLRSIDLTAIAADSSGALWIGSSGGVLHRLLPASGDWTYVDDIALRDAPRKAINALEVWGDSLMVLSEIGISVFSLSRSEFGDSYLRFGTAPLVEGGVTGAARYQGRLWASTRTGVVSTPLSNPNPTEPSSWRVDGLAAGLPSTAVSAILVGGDSLYAATASGIAVWTGASWRTLTGTDTMNVVGLAPTAEGCGPALFITPSSLGAILADGSASVLGSAPGKTLSCISAVGLAGTSNAGVVFFDVCPSAGGPASVAWSGLPPGPASAKFVSIAVDGRGVLWAATGKTAGDGIMRYDGSDWRSINHEAIDELGSNNYMHASVGPDNTAYLGSWGNGLAIFAPDGSLRTVLNTTNGLQPSVGTDAYTVVGGVAVDHAGTAWLTERTPPGDTTLATILTDGTLDYVTGCMYDVATGACNTRTPVRILSDVVIDDYGTKWFANYGRFESEGATGLYFYNESRAIPGARNGWGKLTVSDGLPSNQIWSLATDRYGDVWVGTDLGIAIIYSPTNPRAAIAPYSPLPDQIIQDILVDPLNRKWVATKQGVFLMSPDGTEVLARYTVEGTGGLLLDNDVASLAMDTHTGTVYFGTERGLSSLTTAAAAPAKSYESLRVYPNPFEVPSHPQATVDGLIEGSSLKIFTVDGALVRAVDTPGGRLGFWDGRDDRGDLVSSGVYVVIAYSADGTETGTTKVAVIRK